ncbi:Outer membrane protein TolC [Myxococcus fulvus]|uniref:Outer membrane protein TolC n=1 Tax=Myxococcus fulvus TaxID=33 RepID=A0A511T4H6_MYXFU|nr:TolC family protein [Myxococcus fulvus]AKF82285.1 transporter [Myxococcus fulvus 124B02]GEN09071.1 RND transporter [Myxococcus fulvus]SEU15058.1 Outer membrane protein TolC [Myxococcus fulvus]
MRLRLTLVLLATTCSGCGLVRPVVVTPPPAPSSYSTAVEPRTGPPAPSTAPEGEVPSPGPSKEGGPARPAEHVPQDEVWWSAFADPALDAAIRECFGNSLVLHDVRDLIYENQLDPNVPQGWWYPLQVGILNPAGLSHVVTIVPPAPATQAKYTIATADVGLTYQVDLFGNLAAQRSAGLNFAEQQRQLTEARVQDMAMRLTQLWFDILEARALRDLTQRQIDYNKELLRLIQARFEQHLTPRLAVLQQEQLLLNLEAQVPLISARNALLNSELKALLGRVPDPTDDIVPLERQLPDLPPPPKLGTPGDLNANTPEMRLQELRVAEVEHRINANRASWLPTIQLVGSVGAAKVGLSEPILHQSVVGVNLTWALFDGRRFTEHKRLPIQLHRRHVQYQLALNTAIGRVQDAVVQEETGATSLRALRAQVLLGQQLLDEARRLFEQGRSDYLTVLSALTNLVGLERASLQAQRLLLNHRVAVYRSLGGTWSRDVTLNRE